MLRMIRIGSSRIRLQSHYQILDVSKNASKSEITKAYRELVKQTHPDLFPGNVEKEEQFKLINEAHSILSDNDKRAAYNLEINIENEGFIVKSNMIWNRSKHYKSPYRRTDEIDHKPDEMEDLFDILSSQKRKKQESNIKFDFNEI